MECGSTEGSSRIQLKKDTIVGGPVTCVSLPSDTHCWVARGPYVELFALFCDSSHRNKQSHLAFPSGGTVHGIRHVAHVSDLYLSALFGGRTIAVVLGGSHQDYPLLSTHVQTNQSAQSSNTLQLSDWIWDVRTIGTTSQEGTKSIQLLLAVALANNVCEIWKWNGSMAFERIDENQDVVFVATKERRIVGTDRCITYSMSFFGWTSPTDALTVAAGTVTNEVLIWTVLEASQTQSLTMLKTLHDRISGQNTQREAMHRLRGHEGVIHSVVFNSMGDKLVSTSDDRTVRLWWKDNTGCWRLQWIAWGHTARIWGAAFASGRVISTGEDGTVRIWRESSGEQVGQIRNHNCLSQWCLDVRENLVLVGSNDGTAKLYNWNDRIVTDSREVGTGTHVECIVVPDDRGITTTTTQTLDPTGEHPDTKTKKSKKAKVLAQTIIGMKFYSDGKHGDGKKILLATRAGSFLVFCINEHAWLSAQPWWDETLQVNADDGSCIAVHPSGELGAVGTTRGQIVLAPISIGDEQNSQQTVLDGKQFMSVQGLHWLDGASLLSFHIKGIVIWWKIKYDAVDTGGELVHVLNTGIHAVPLCCAWNEMEQQLFIGDSRGNISVFSLESLAIGSHEEQVPTNTLMRAHGKEHVTAIVCIDNRTIISVGNDRCVSTSAIRPSGKIHQGTAVPVQNMTGICHLWLARHANGGEIVLITGYHGNRLVSIDFRTGYELFQANTGGRQRQHDCFVTLNLGSSASFPYSHGVVVCTSVKDGRNHLLLQTNQVSGRTFSSLELQPLFEYNMGVPLHGEPVFDACLFSTSPDSKLIAMLTGSEDCTARLSVYDGAQIINSEALPSQESCIRAVAASRHDTLSSTLLVICGGKLKVQFYVLKDPGKGVAPFSVSYLGLGRFSCRPSIDHRINAVAATPFDGTRKEENHLVLTGDSNGCIFAFLVSESEESLYSSLSSHLLFDVSRPVLVVEVVRVISTYIVIAGTSGGDIYLWMLPGGCDSLPFSTPRPPSGKYKAHQMGTNCISALVVKECKQQAILVIASGGDDQAVAVNSIHFSLDTNQTLDGLARLQVSETHVTSEASLSAIKGLKIIRSDLLVTVGYSQRLALWRLSSNRPHLRLLSMVPVDVADVNCLAHVSFFDSRTQMQKDVIAVCGEGVEFFSVV